ncbi:MAG TPA: S41 family peptidase [Mucilaginibacter sp.]|jgi:hypothetical protein|nr:S41 family peptidase [Mucilaginibacter sp.]
MVDDRAVFYNKVMKKVVLILFLSGFFSPPVKAQTCSCSLLLDSLIQKVETDYAGYIHKVKEPGNPRYYTLKKELRSKSEKVQFPACYSVLENYTRFFNDGHLFIAELPDETPLQTDSLYRLIKHFSIPANYVELLKNNAVKDAVEGIWKDTYNEQIAIIKKSDNHFYGVIQQSSIPKWEPGMVKMEIEKIKKNQYNISYYRSDFAKIHFTDARIYKNIFLPFGIYRLAKILPHNAEINYVNITNPSLPVISIINQKNILLTIPSALIDRNYLDSLLDKYDTAIKSTPNLIIDIRGNTGGNFIWGKLYDIANTIVHPSPKQNTDDDFRLLASYDDAAYVKKQIAAYADQNDSAEVNYYRRIVEKIKNNAGKVIGFSYYRSAPDTATRIVYKYPQRIAIIVDKGVASAAEAFILGMKETSSKVVLYGNNTKGEIDYMNVNTISFGGNGNKAYYLGYPTYFAKDIRTHPINPTGIKPDVYIPANTSDGIQWVVRALSRKSANKHFKK